MPEIGRFVRVLHTHSDIRKSRAGFGEEQILPALWLHFDRAGFDHKSWQLEHSDWGHVEDDARLIEHRDKSSAVTCSCTWATYVSTADFVFRLNS